VEPGVAEQLFPPENCRVRTGEDESGPECESTNVPEVSSTEVVLKRT